MDAESRVLACVDQSHFAEYVADYAAWAAKRLAATLEFLHILDRHPEIGSTGDHSGAIGIDAQERLLSSLSDADQSRMQVARETGRLFLNGLRQRALASGAGSVDVRQRHGELVETLVEQERGVELIVLGRRGESAESTQRDLGRNVERVVRALHHPILAVTEGFIEPTRVMIAFDGGSVTRRGVAMIAASPLFRGLPIHVLMAGRPRDDATKQLDWAQGTLASAGFDVTHAFTPGDPESVIARAVTELQIGVLIMGAYTHSPWRNLFMGSKTSDLLRSSRVPTLLLR